MAFDSYQPGIAICGSSIERGSSLPRSSWTEQLDIDGVYGGGMGDVVSRSDDMVASTILIIRLLFRAWDVGILTY
jgi:hypothetical protein